MKKWDASCSALPANVKRVQALHRLHEQGTHYLRLPNFLIVAHHFSERVSLLAGLRDSVEKAVAADRETLRDLQVARAIDSAICILDKSKRRF